MKKITILVAIVLMAAFAFMACAPAQQPQASEQPKASEEQSQTPAETPAEPSAQTGDKTDIDFYGKIVEYEAGPPATDLLKEKLTDKYNVEALQVDWGNLDTVIRTGISSGEPCDVYQYWPQNMRPLIDAGMALDLTPYIESDPDIKNMIAQSALDAGKFDGKYYALPMDANFSLMVVNQDLLEENGITIPDNWNWEQYLEVNKQIKDKGLFPMGMNTDNQQSNWFFRNGMLSLAATDNRLEELAAGQIPLDDPMFATVFTNIKNLYDNGYMYPGDGAVTVTRDEVKAGFMQGKLAMMADIAAGVSATLKEAKEAGINATVIPWPSMGDVNAVLGGYDGLFIPANAKNPEASFEVIKTYLGSDIQKLFADTGMAIVNQEVEITDPTVQKVIELSKSVYPFEFITLDAKINDYFANEALAEVVLGGGPEAVQKAVEALRTAAIS